VIPMSSAYSTVFWMCVHCLAHGWSGSTSDFLEGDLVCHVNGIWHDADIVREESLCGVIMTCCP